VADLMSEGPGIINAGVYTSKQVQREIKKGRIVRFGQIEKAAQNP